MSISYRPRRRGSFSRVLVCDLGGKQIRRATYRSIRQLEDAIRDYLKRNNAGPKLFVWKKSADATPASIERFFQGISSSGY